MDSLFQDARFAVRLLRKSPAFSCAAIATIALGIGATTAIFSAMNAALLRPLPFPQAEDLFRLRTTITTGRMTSGLVAPVELNGLTDANGPIVRAAGSAMTYDTILDNSASAVQVSLAGVTQGYFELFNAPMVLGRSFVPEEFAHGEKIPVPPRVIVLSSHLWRTAFGSDPDIVGRTIQLSGRALPVIGVASPAYDAVTTADAWYNLALDRRNISHSYEGYMRVRHGASPAAVDTALSVVATRLAGEFPVFNTDRVFVSTPLIDAIVGDLKPTLIIAFAATALLLLIACVNVMNLLLARGAARTREIAVRASLGASRAALVRCVLLEGLMLSAVGGVIGAVVATAGVRVLLLLAQSRLPRLEAVPLDPYVAGFALAATLATGLAIGLLPAIRLQRTDVATLLGSARSVTATRSTHRTLAGMIAAEMALAVTLVAGAGWLIQNFQNLNDARSGFVAEQRLVVDVLLPSGRFRHPDQIDAWNRAVRDRIGGLNGVAAVGASSSMPLRPERDSTFNFTVAGDPTSQYPPSARLRLVTAGWFEAMGIQIDAGRSFLAQDRFGEGAVVVINQALAERYLPGRNPLEAGLALSGFGPKDPVVPIVGVIADVKYASVSERAEPAVYMIGRGINRQSIVVSTTLADPSQLVPLIRSELQQLDPLVPLDFAMLPNVVSESLSRQRLGMLLMIFFGVTAIALAAIGVYGVFAYSISQRTREVAIRLAVGATPAEVFRLTFVRGQLIAVAGVLGGVILAYSAGRILAGTLYEVRAADPLILASSTLLVASVAALATVLPARRAARIDPVVALRAE
jgi:putative ABC transport system permease protein